MVFKLLKNTTTTGFYVYGIGGIIFSIWAGILNIGRIAVYPIEFMIIAIMSLLLLVFSIILVISPSILGFKIEKMQNKELYMHRTCTATCGRRLI